jgi:hexosaminidase
MNVFHWHLTDDQGWRIEIKRYPKLTEVGSVRAQTLVGSLGKWPHRFDGTPYGGFYTQDDIRRVVAFAARRHIAVVPEIDMPGHMAAAIAAYPELGNGFVARPRVRCGWGISQEILNLNDATVRFCEDVWGEIFGLFPFRYAHLGGDEAPTQEWEESDAAQRVMAARGITTPRGMQSWFTAHMDAFFRAHGRRLIGWDEILEGPGVDASAAVMYWRPWATSIDIGKAAAEGHPIVVADTGSLYFDYYQAEPQSEEPLAIGGLVTLPHVYSFDPLARIPASAAGRVLGSQGQLWTEYIATRDYLDYMAYPRACALAEVLWTPKERRSYAGFSARLAAHRARLAAQGVAACPRP